MQTPINISSVSAPAPYPGAPTHTKVLGYYNPFDYPFQLHVPELNRQFTLGAREFVTLSVDGKDATGKALRQKVKINDPIFENFCGPNKLAKEEGAADVPILWLARPVLQPIPTHMFEFAGSTKFKTDEGGRVLSPEHVIRDQQQQMTSVPASASAITGYTVEQAKQMGVIAGNTRGLIREEMEVQASKAVPPHASRPALPSAPPPKQPNAQRPVPPPFVPPADNRILMPKNPPPTVPVSAPPVAPVSAPSTAIDTTPPALDQMVPTDDLMSDVPTPDDKVSVDGTDLTKLAHETAVAAGAIAPASKPATVEETLPEPTLPETAAAPGVLAEPAPVVAAAPIPVAPAPAPQAPVVTPPPAQPRRARRTLAAIFTGRKEEPTTPPAQPPTQ